jgi:hypothetical protein
MKPTLRSHTLPGGQGAACDDTFKAKGLLAVSRRCKNFLIQRSTRGPTIKRTCREKLVRTFCNMAALQLQWQLSPFLQSQLWS